MEKRSKKIVVVGSCMMDFVSYAPKLPKAGETVHGSQFATNFGGKGANQCVAAAKLGGETTLIARVGTDIHADDYINNLIAHKIDAKHVLKTKGEHTGIAQIVVSAEGENQIIVVSGANRALSTHDIEQCKKVIETASVLVCQLETSIEVAIKAMKIAKGISILNGAPSLKTYPPELLSLPTIFCVNESEAADFSGVSVTSVKEGILAIRQLLTRGCKNVILTMGSGGVLYANWNRPHDIQQISCPKVDCVDSTGAGDSFIGTLAFLLASGSIEDIEEFIKIACHVASDSVTRPGTQKSYSDEKILTRFKLFKK